LIKEKELSAVGTAELEASVKARTQNKKKGYRGTGKLKSGPQNPAGSEEDTIVA